MDPDVLLLTVDQTETIVATVKPANASNKRVTWSSSDPAVATVDANGKVTAVKGGTATITVTSVADSSKKATKQVLVGDKLVPAGGIIQEVIDEAEDEDVIAVAPSTYKEQLVINKSLTLLGPNAGIAGTGNRNAEAVITYPDEPKNNSGSSGDYAGLVLVEADDVVISGFTFDDGDKSVNSRLTRGINAHGSNIQITNNIVDGFNYVQILITSSFLDENNNWERYSEYCENAFVEGNYGKNALNFSSIYLQGAAGTVKNNTVENACRAIQIQPYGEQKGGIVENNELNGFRTGIYYNYANKGAGKWLIRDNDITATAVPEGFDQSGEWAGIEVQTFGTSGSGDAPKVSFEGNAVDGSGSNLETVGILMTTPIDDAAEATFTNNTFTGVNVGVDRQAGALMLGDVLENNVFPDGSIVIGDQIKVFVPKEEKVYNKNTGAEFDTIQDAVNAANEDDTILVGPGTFEIDNTLNITVPLTIKGMGPEKTIIDVTKVTDEHNCWGVLVGKSNTVLCDLAIVSTEGRAGYNNLKVSDEFAASVEHLDNIVIENVLIEGGKGIDIHNADATLDNVTVKESKGASIAVSNGSNVTIRDCTTADGAWGSIGVMYKEGYRKSTVTVEDGNEFGEGVLYCERYKAESGNEIVGLGAEWQSYINVERDQLLWVKELPKGAFIEAEDGPNRWYATIQSAVDAATGGDTILVGPGEYEEQVTISKSVTLEGAQAGVDARGRENAQESIICGNLANNEDLGNGIQLIDGADDVTIDGFTFTKTAGFYGSFQEHGVLLLCQEKEDPAGAKVVIKNNRFVDIAGRPILKNKTDDAVRRLDILHNVFLNVSSNFEPNDKRTAIKLRFKGENSTGCIDGNIIDGATYAGIILDDAAGFEIVNNIISNTPPYGIGVKVAKGGRLIVTDNVFNSTPNTHDSGEAIRIKEGGQYGSLEIESNTITNYHIGVLVQRGNNVDTFQVRGNTFGGNDIAIENQNQSILDATNNYWGHASGPYNGLSNPEGQGNSVSNNVVFFPWYTDEGLTELSPYEKGIINARDLSSYKSIQAAINAAQPGDTIFVSEGTYTVVDLTIDRNLTLEATDGPDTTTIQGNIKISGDNVTNVTIEGFTINGEVEGPAGCDPQAIFDNNVFPVGYQIVGNKITRPTVSNGDELLAALEDESLKMIFLKDGKYYRPFRYPTEVDRIQFEIKREVALVAENKGQAKLIGKAVEILADNVTLDGLVIQATDINNALSTVDGQPIDGLTLLDLTVNGAVGLSLKDNASIVVRGVEITADEELNSLWISGPYWTAPVDITVNGVTGAAAIVEELMSSNTIGRAGLVPTRIPYVAEGEITDIEPDIVIYDVKGKKFDVPAGSGVTGFTFKDGGTEMKATLVDDEWTITEVEGDEAEGLKVEETVQPANEDEVTDQTNGHVDGDGVNADVIDGEETDAETDEIWEEGEDELSTDGKEENESPEGKEPVDEGNF